MDQIKIGKFICIRRKEAKLTQSELAEKLGVSDRAVSKWENGNCMPDCGIIPELCKTLNELDCVWVKWGKKKIYIIVGE